MSNFENFVQCRVVTPFAASSTEIGLFAAEEPYRLPPEGGGVLVLTDSPYRPGVFEVVRYERRTDLALYGVSRAQEGTTARDWTGVAFGYQALTAEELQTLLGEKADKSSLAEVASSIPTTPGEVGADPAGTAANAVKALRDDALIALVAKAPLDSPVFSGTPRAPTPAVSSNDTQLATTQFVQLLLAALVDSSPEALNTLSELAAALGNDPNFATTVLNALAGKMEIGTGGIGLTVNPTAILDANTDLPSGLYRVPDEWVGSPYQGKVALNQGSLIHIPAFVTTAYATQIFQRMQSNEIKYRHKNAGTWSDWDTAFHTGNLTIQSSPSDPTLGALMQVGAFGLGRYTQRLLTGIDLNTEDLPVGFYSGNAWTNTPLGILTSHQWGYLVVENLASAFPLYIKQTFTAGFGGTRVWVRVKYNGVWGKWSEQFHSINILGPVSQSAGVPTGAIIERGGNANGQYIKYADGTQICTMHRQVVVPISLVSNGNPALHYVDIDFVYPAAFAAIDSVTPGGGRHSSDAIPIWLGSRTQTGSGAVVRAYATQSSASLGVSVYLTVIGRWYI